MQRLIPETCKMMSFCATGVVFLLGVAVVLGVQLDDRCSDDYQCNVIIDAECRNNKCECTPETLRHEGSCVRAVPGTSSCLVDNDCKTPNDERRVCVQNQCACIPTHHLIENICEKSRSLREHCLNNAQCYWGQSMQDKMSCRFSTCRCNDGFVPWNGRVCKAGASGNVANIFVLIAVTITSCLYLN